MTHCRSDSEASSWLWMSGSATFTIVMSSSSMNTPVQTAVRVHHLGSRPMGVGVVTTPSSHRCSGARATVVESRCPEGELAAQLEHRRAIGLLDLVGRFLRAAEPLDADTVDPSDDRTRMDRGHRAFSGAVPRRPGDRRTRADAHVAGVPRDGGWQRLDGGYAAFPRAGTASVGLVWSRTRPVSWGPHDVAPVTPVTSRRTPHHPRGVRRSEQAERRPREPLNHKEHP